MAAAARVFAAVGRRALPGMQERRAGLERRALPLCPTPPPQSGGEGVRTRSAKRASSANCERRRGKRRRQKKAPAKAAPEIPKVQGTYLVFHRVLLFPARPGRKRIFAMAIWFSRSQRAKIKRVSLLLCWQCCLEARYKMRPCSLGRRCGSSYVRPRTAGHRTTAATPKSRNLEKFWGYNCVVGERALAVGMRGLAS